MKRKTKQITYQHERTSYKGIEERLALASLAFSETWELPKGGEYGHRVRFISKKDGWECRFNWHDNKRHIDLTEVGKHIALGIEAARQRWHDARYPSKAMREAWAGVEAKLNARKVAA